MAVFTVDSDSILTSTAAVRGTIERLQAESNGMLAASSGSGRDTWAKSYCVSCPCSSLTGTEPCTL